MTRPCSASTRTGARSASLLLPLLLLPLASVAAAAEPGKPELQPTSPPASPQTSPPTSPLAPSPQPRPPKTLTVTTHLISPFFGAYYLDTHLRVAKAVAAFASFSYLSLTHDDWKTHTGTVGAGASYYWQGEALRRWYVEASAELLLSHWRHEPSGNAAPLVPGFSVGSVVGYRWVTELGPMFDLGMGVVVLHFPSARVETDAGPVSSSSFTQVYPGLKFNVGWAF